MHMRQAFKRRGNMSYDDSRAGNATSEVCPVWNRVRGDMRIVCLIAVGAWLLAVAMAEGDVPIGAPQYHQRMNRPIILEPVKRYEPDAVNPFSWFFNMVSRVMEPPKKSPPRMIGPFSLPGMGGQVYIKQLENTLPWQSSHVVIRLMNRDPENGISVPMDANGVSHNHVEDPSRRVVKPYQAYQTANNPPIRANNMIQQGFVPSSPSQASLSWSMNPYRQRPQQYTKPFRPSSPNDFRYESYGKQADQSFTKEDPTIYYGTRPPLANNYQQFPPNAGTANSESLKSISSSPTSRPMIYQPTVYQTSTDHSYSGNDLNQQSYKDGPQIPNRYVGKYYNENWDSSRTTQTPYPVYPPLREDEVRSSLPRNIVNESRSINNDSVDDYRGSSRYRAVVRSDRMVPVAGNHRNNFASMKTRPRSSKPIDPPESSDSRGVREGSAAKFDSDDAGGMEVIAAPTLKIGWDRENSGMGKIKVSGRGSTGKSRESDSGLNQDEDSMSMGNGKNLARGETAEHENESLRIIVEQPAISRRSQSRISEYNVIDRTHKSSDGLNLTAVTLERFDKKSSVIGEKKNKSIDKSDKPKEVLDDVRKMEKPTKTGNVTSAVVQRVMNLTASNIWRLPKGRRPRIVKAIYRRKPKISIIKSTRESSVSKKSSQDKSSSAGLLDKLIS